MIAGVIRLLTGVQCNWQMVVPFDRPCVFVANHSSHLDALALWAALPPVIRQRTRPVAAQDYWSGGLKHWLARHVIDAVLIPRKDITRDNHPIQLMAEAIDQGSSLILFPEGGRQIGGSGDQVAALKPGIYHLASEREITVVPVWLSRLGHMLPKGEWLPVPYIGHASFGEPIQLNDNENKEMFLDRCRDALTKLAHDRGSYRYE